MNNITLLTLTTALLSAGNLACSQGEAHDGTIIMHRTQELHGELIEIDIEIHDQIPADLLGRVLASLRVERADDVYLPKHRTIWDPFVRLRTSSKRHVLVLPSDIEVDLKAFAEEIEMDAQWQQTAMNPPDAPPPTLPTL